jgi:DNA-damage-inducible protein J
MKHTGSSVHLETTKRGYVHSRIDETIKEQASFILDKIGLNVSDAIRLFLNQVVMRKGMPFPVSIPNAETIAAMESSEKGEDLEEITIEQLRAEFKSERKNIRAHKKKNKNNK